MRGKDVVHEMKRMFGLKTDADLRRRLGVTAQCIHNWKSRRSMTSEQVARLVRLAYKAATTDSHASAIRPIVEFFQISTCTSRQGKHFEMFSGRLADGDEHPYLTGLRKELSECSGVYVFFDSRGHAIYVGKARKQSLLKEMKAAFNRNRGDIQKIRRVRHPSRRQKYTTSNEIARQIDEYVVPLYELAHYFSAYQVADGMIGELEALLVRCFANDLLNLKMEKFGRMRANQGR